MLFKTCKPQKNLIIYDTFFLFLEEFVTSNKNIKLSTNICPHGGIHISGILNT